MPRVACVQMDVTYGDRDGNTRRIIDHIHVLKAQNVDIVVFPECSIGGYCVETPEQRSEVAVPAYSNHLLQIQEAVDVHDMIAVVGFAESGEGDCFYNSAALFCPGENPRVYHKTHLPELGYDRFVTPGDDFPVFDTKHGRLGLLICFDIRFPEAARILALKGADAILLPTNWPTGADISADLLALARAVENKVYVATCNRVGTEKGFTFIGKSKIIDPMGTILASAGAEEKVLIADLDFEVSRNKRNVTVPGKHETTIFDSRRPELYASFFGHTVPITVEKQ
ncbi:MAG: carbon-nitrogen hydrolase family protein [Armatimonadetes bacterium]|nr:carbon-nitrogen hydrolase family protein [Armatimonadota bacterium]